MNWQSQTNKEHRQALNQDCSDSDYFREIRTKSKLCVQVFLVKQKKVLGLLPLTIGYVPRQKEEKERKIENNNEITSHLCRKKT
jgi:excinuclease UvrABC nuclease subunit